MMPLPPSVLIELFTLHHSPPPSLPSLLDPLLHLLVLLFLLLLPEPLLLQLYGLLGLHLAGPLLLGQPPLLIVQVLDQLLQELDLH